MKRCGILICVGERYKILKHPIRGSVGTGRRARLRILWWLHRVGSSPIFRTKGAVALTNIFCWAAALLYAQMGAKSVVISPPSLINTVHSQTSLLACLISNCFVFNH